MNIAKKMDNHPTDSASPSKMIKFNYNLIIDILYTEEKLVLHLIDKITCFQVGQSIKDIFVKHVKD